MSENKVKRLKIKGISRIENKDYLGYKINTNKEPIILKISNRDFCCEEWGCFFCDEDGKDIDITKFIKKKIYNISIGYKGYKHFDQNCDTCYKKLKECHCQHCPVFYLNIELNKKKIIQLGVYNIHNGYYSHDVIVSYYGVQKEEVL